MVKELTSVLAVRSLEKQRRRLEEKQKRKLLKENFTLVESHISSDAKNFLKNSHVPNQPLSMNECAVGSKSSSQLDVEGKDQDETHIEGHNTEYKHGTDVLRNQRPSEVSLHVQSDMKFGTQDMLVQNPTVLKTTGDRMHLNFKLFRSNTCEKRYTQSKPPMTVPLCEVEKRHSRCSLKG